MQVDEKEFFFKQATGSDATDYWYGPHLGDPVPDKAAFFEDFEEYYFTDFKDNKGRCFHIIEGGDKIGQINYNEIKNANVEIDIIIYSKENWSKGYGSSAVKLMSSYLESRFHVKSIFIDVHPENDRAIKAYDKAGFSKKEKYTEEDITYFRVIRECKE